MKEELPRQGPWKLFIYTCFGGCATGVAASKACIKLWEKNTDDIKIACLPAVIVPWKTKEMLKSSEKRILIDACGVRCGAKLIERERFPVHRYIELTSELGIRKVKQLPSKDLEDEVYKVIEKEVTILLGKNLPEGEKVKLGLLVAFGTDDGENLNNDHVGMAKYFYVYRFSNDKEELIERRENAKLKGDESMKHGDPEKAKATSSVLENVDVLVGRRFGPNLTRLVKKFVCVVVRTNTITNAIECVHNSMDLVVEQKNKREDRKHIILRPEKTMKSNCQDRR
jgi:uncharacterized metal-binding protein/predicted Fe-Mo cluster-binding NifX family protein